MLFHNLTNKIKTWKFALALTEKQEIQDIQKNAVPGRDRNSLLLCGRKKKLTKLSFSMKISASYIGEQYSRFKEYKDCFSIQSLYRWTRLEKLHAIFPTTSLQKTWSQSLQNVWPAFKPRNLQIGINNGHSLLIIWVGYTPLRTRRFLSSNESQTCALDCGTRKEEELNGNEWRKRQEMGIEIDKKIQ